MSTYEDHIDALEGAKDLPFETAEVASEAISFVAALHGLYVDNGVLNEDAPVDVQVLENLVDAYHGELAAAALLLSEDSFRGVPEFLRATASTMEDTDQAVPVVIRKGYERLANRIEQTRRLKSQMSAFMKTQEENSENSEESP